MLAALLRAIANLWKPRTGTPPAPKPVTPPPAPIAVPSGQFDKCVKLVLVHEGGNDDDPHDPGGRTSRGITAGDWAQWRKTHPGLPSDVWQAPQADVLAIYHQKYWDVMKCDTLAPGLDYCTFDSVVLEGEGKARPYLAAVAALAPQAAINKFCDLRLAHLRSLPGWARYGRGWGNRVFEVRRDALAMVVQTQPLPPPPKPILPPDHPAIRAFGLRVKATMLAKGYPWADDQNVVTVEGANPDGTVNKNRPNAFDDVKMVLNGDGVIIGGPWEATSHPGYYYTQHPVATGGAFIIALGPQTCWTAAEGDFHGPAWRQAEDSFIMGHRDPHATYKRQGPPIKHGPPSIGVHHHQGFNNPQDNIGTSDAGCQVIRLTSEQNAFVALTKKSPRYLKDPHGFRLTATVLEAKDLLP